jgi:hypothetical protein
MIHVFDTQVKVWSKNSIASWRAKARRGGRLCVGR